MLHRFFLLAGSLLTLFIFNSVSFGSNVSTQPSVVPDASVWAKQHFRKGTLPPFAFSYDGVHSSSFLKSWKYLRTDAGEESDNFQVVYKDVKSGLSVICDVIVFNDFNAVEWTLRFKNDGKINSAMISDVGALDIDLTSKGIDNQFLLNHLNGSVAAADDFAPHYDSIENGDSLYFRSAEGRSSSGAFPFFNLLYPSRTFGVVASIGWTGNWYADFKSVPVMRSGVEQLAMSAGMTDFEAYLEPGEEVRMPKISLMFWSGGRADEMNMTGNNKFRRFVLAHHSRKIAGETVQYPLCGGFNWGDPAPLNEYTGLTTPYANFLIDRYAEFDIMPEAFWLDAGWYKNAADWKRGMSWSKALGSWIEDTKRFPGTLKEISDHAHEKGAKFMVWFEPERVYRGSDIYKEHRDWLIARPDAVSQFLVDLGNPQALDWLCHHIGDFMESRGIDIYRQDYNIAPEPIWEAIDKPGRRGITEVRYIEGLYKFWDYLLERFPNLLIDNCASGGRRLDLETIGRSAPLWRTDYNYGEVNGYQNQTYGLEFFLPQHGTGVYKTDHYSSRSCYSSAMAMNFKMTDRSLSFFEMKKVYDEYAKVRPYFLEDFYPLSGVDDIASLDRWIVYELFRPSDETGYLFAFRRKDSGDSSFVVRLQGLDPAKEYSLKNVDSGEEFKATGDSLASGYSLKIENPEGCLLVELCPSDSSVE